MNLKLRGLKKFLFVGVLSTADIIFSVSKYLYKKRGAEAPLSSLRLETVLFIPTFS
jgi:hypothetical protein